MSALCSQYLKKKDGKTGNLSVSDVLRDRRINSKRSKSYKGNFTGKVAKIVSQGPKIRLHFFYEK